MVMLVIKNMKIIKNNKRIFQKTYINNVLTVVFRFLCLLPLVGGWFILLTKQLEWYDRNRKIYHIWFIPSSLYLIGFLIIYNIK